MNTNRNLTAASTQFKRLVKGEIAVRGLTITRLASQVGYSRNAVSRAINQGHFPRVQSALKQFLLIHE